MPSINGTKVKLAANFNGLDLNAVNPSETRFISDDLTIASGDIIAIQNPDIYNINFWLGADRPAFVYQDSAGDAAFENHGTINISLGPVTPEGEAPGGLIGFAISRYSGEGPSAAFRNAVDGNFIVDSQWVDSSGDLTLGTTYGFYAPQQTVGFRNDGYFEVQAASGIAYGYSIAGPSAYGSAPFVNTGTFNVTSVYEAWGIRMGTANDFTNSGTIRVQGGVFAYGVWRGAVQSSFVAGTALNNAGEIIVSTAPGSPYASIGIFAEDVIVPADGAYHYYNSGLIQADIAIYVWDEGTYQLITDHIHNSGTIIGDILLSFGNDIVDNSGSISGSVLLGPGDDRYEGALGVSSGTIEGGTGNDFLIGGAAGENLYGDAGNDTIIGGAGDDFIEGGLGTDRLDGGSGSDVLSFHESLIGVTVDLAGGTASDGLAVDTLSGFENVLGSRFADRLGGSGLAEVLIGGGGDDSIDGGGGNDVIEGGQGADDLTGGKGSDTFLFSAGDGVDLIRDFSAGDALAIYGYASAVSVTQVGPDVQIVLSASDRVTLLNTTVGAVQGSLSFTATPLEGFTPPAYQTILAANQDLVIPAGVTMTLTDPAVLQYREAEYDGLGILLTGTSYTDTSDLFNAGTFSYVDSGRPLILGIRHDTSGYWSDNARFVNQATGSFSIENQNGTAIGVMLIPNIWNLGSISVVSDDGDAYGFTDLSPYLGLTNDTEWFNSGTIQVEATGRAIGLGQYFKSSTSAWHIHNSGLLAVDGQEGSIGIDWIASTHPAVSLRPFIFNSGQIIATDNTIEADSAAISVDWTFDAQIWNSGTLEGDYSIKRGFGFSGVTSGTLSIYNSGVMDGDVQLLSVSASDLDTRNVRFVNNGTVNGNVSLTDGDDFFDGRLGQFSGMLLGNGGNDQLFAGSGGQSLFGGAGNDLLSGGAGDDTLTGGEGADRFRVESGFGTDTVTDFSAASGDVIEVSGYTTWVSIAQVGGDVVVTFSATDKLVIKDQLLANITTAQFSFGATAIATIPIPSAPVAPSVPASPQIQLSGTSADDRLLGAAIGDSINGLAGDDTIKAGGGEDSLYGDSGNDRLDGEIGNDLLYGGDGDDVLVGGPGADILNGGSGNDTFQDTKAGLNGDTISDFGVGDRIVITDASLAGFTSSLSGNTLNFTGGSLTLSQPVNGILVARAAAGGGVELVVNDARNDFNGDGRSDVLWRSDSGQLTDWLGQANGGFVDNGGNATTFVPVSWVVAGTGDLNGDGRDDILWRNSDGQLTNWLGTANGGFTDNGANGYAVVATSWHVAGIADFNGDGRDDILWRNDNGAMTNWLGTASGGYTDNSANASVTIGTSWQIAGTGDFNGDGRDDILWRNTDGSLTDWLGQANGSLANNAAASTSVATSWQIAATGDFNGDGRDDILWRNTDGQLTDWLGQADGSFANNPNASVWVPTSWHIAATGDFNGDGRDDILWRNDSGDLTNWLGQADGSFANNPNASVWVPTNWHVQVETLL